MKSKVIFVVLCAVLLLLFTSFSHDGRGNLSSGKDQPADSLQHQDPADPWDHLEFPTVEENENWGVLTIIIDLNPFSLYIY